MHRVRQWRSRRKRDLEDVGATSQRDDDNVSAVTQSTGTTLPQRSKAPAPVAASTANAGRPQPSVTDLHDATKKNYWQLAVQELQKTDTSIGEQIAAVQNAATATGQVELPTLLLRATERARDALEEKRWTITIGARKVVVREQFDKLISTILLFKDVGGAAASLDPVHAGLPLAGFCVLMQMATSDSEQFMEMVIGVEEIMTIMVRYQEIERLYHSRPETASKQNFERRLINLYKQIIRYLISSTSYFRRNTMLNILRSFPKLDNVSDVMAAVRRDDSACKDIAQVFDSSDANDRYQEFLKKFNDVESYLQATKDQGSLGSSTRVVERQWGVARQINTLFTGREDLLQELQTIVRDRFKDNDQKSVCQIVVSGMGGQGKSELCLQLLRSVWPILWGAFWIDVSTEALAEKGFLDIARQLKLSAQTWEEARQGLANVKHPWLLVLDNADDPEVDYQKYFPAGPSGVVMLTSRIEQCAVYGTTKHIPLEGLSDEAAWGLLFKAARVPQDKQGQLLGDAKVLARLLGSHPLALIQAGAYTSRGHCTLAEYPAEYARQRKRLMKFRPEQAKSRYGDVYATFEASTTALGLARSGVAEDALELLPIMAACGPSRLPLPLFEAAWEGAQQVLLDTSAVTDGDEMRLTRWHVSRLPSFITADEDAWDSFRLVEAIHLLKSFSLVSTDMYDGYLSVSMHALVHAWARDRQSGNEQHEAWLKTGCLVALSFSDGALWQRGARQLQPHLQAVVSWSMSTMFQSEPVRLIVCVLVNCGWELHNMRDDKTLFLLLQKLYSQLDIDQYTVDGPWLVLYELSGSNLLNYGHVQQAVKVLQEVLRIQVQTLKEDHPDRLASQHELARAYQANGQVKEAVALLEEVVRIQAQTRKEDHPDRLASQHELAGAYHANGQVTEAVALLEEVVRIKAQTLKEDHPDRLASQHELAGAYHANGQVTEAVALLEEVVRIKAQTLQEDHPDRLASQHTLAGGYEANGQVKEAVVLLEEVVRIRTQTLQEDHPDRLASQHELARTYQANGQIEEAVALLEEVVRIQAQTRKEDHPDRLASEHELAVVYKANGQVKEAVALLEEVVRIKAQTRKEDHPSRLASEHELAVVYKANGQVKEAVALLEEVVRIQAQTRKEDHPDRLVSEHVLATYLWEFDQEAALEMMRQVVRIRQRALDAQHPDRLNSEAWLEHLESLLHQS